LAVYARSEEILAVAYPDHLDNHSAHISKETRAWLADQPAGRFEFTFTPKHGSWLNLVEGFFFQARPFRPPPHPRHLPTNSIKPHDMIQRRRQPKLVQSNRLKTGPGKP
jgi:hypothetical protein